MSDEALVGVTRQMCNVVRRSGNEVIDSDDPETISEQAVGKMGSQEAGASRNNDSFLLRIWFKHG